MPQKKDLGFLNVPPAPVQGNQNTDQSKRLSDETVSRLMAIPGVDGVWVESVARNIDEVVVYITNSTALSRIPAVVENMPVRIQRGEPIRAY
jgi:hypothetical protein